MNNQQPFKIGQRVVALVNGVTFKKNDIVTILDVKYGCCHWMVDVGELSPVTVSMQCKHCGEASVMELIKGNPMWPQAVCFAPVVDQYADIREELAEQGMNVHDTADTMIKQLLNN